MRDQLALDEGDELAGGHGIQFGPLPDLIGPAQQELDLFLACAIDAQTPGERALVLNATGSEARRVSSSMTRSSILRPRSIWLIAPLP